MIRRQLINMFCNRTGTNKADRTNCRVFAQRIDDFATAMNDVQDTIGQSRLVKQLGQPNGTLRHLFAGLQDECISTGDRQWDHDRNSMFADPIFVNPANGDYNLKLGSPAWSLWTAAACCRFPFGSLLPNEG